jgi:hypothetical protein
MIQFDYVSTIPFIELEILSNDDGSSVRVVKKDNYTDVEWHSLSLIDRILIKSQVWNWVNHYRYMRDEWQEPHPADDDFGPSYVKGLNEDMNR